MGNTFCWHDKGKSWTEHIREKDFRKHVKKEKKHLGDIKESRMIS